MYPPLSLRTDPLPLKPKECAALAQKMGMDGEWKGLIWRLPFFKGKVELVEMTSENAIPVSRVYIMCDEDVSRFMPYTTGELEKMAAQYGLVLARDTIDDYVRFYLGFTRGQAGRVMPVEQVEQLPLREELTLITRRKLQNGITPIIVENANQATGCFLIGDKIFMAKAEADEGGTVALEPLTMIADTLPILDSLLEE